MEERKFKNYVAKWDRSEKDSKISVYRDDEYLYDLRYDRTSKKTLFEFFEIDNAADPIIGKTELMDQNSHNVVCLYSYCQNSIVVINADIGHTDNDDDEYSSTCHTSYIVDYKLFDNKEYLYLSGYNCIGFPMREIFHVPSLLKSNDCEDIYISSEDWNKEKYDNSINLYGCESMKDFLDKKDKIFFDLQVIYSTKKYNQNKSNDNLLRVLLLAIIVEDTLINLVPPEIINNIKKYSNGQTNKVVKFLGDSKDRLKVLLNEDQNKFYIETFGNTSGDHLITYNTCLYDIIKYDETNTEIDDIQTMKYNQSYPRRSDTLTFLIPKILCSNMLKKLPFSEYNLRFEVHGNVDLTINYKQELTFDEYDDNSKCNRYNVDPTKECKIIIS